MVFHSSRRKCYCAFCKSERMVYTKRRVNIFNILAAMIASVLSMLAIWQQFDPRVMLLFVAFLGLGEGFVQIRWRLNIICKECGFDPVLFLKDTDRAVQKVKETLDRRKQDPASLLRAPLNIQPIMKKADRQHPTRSAKGGLAAPGSKSVGKLVSKQV